MDMTNKDWEIVLAEHRESFHIMADAVNPTGQAKPIERKGSYNQIFKYIRIGKSTPKASFFITDEKGDDVFGFWCPNSAVVTTQKDEVHIEKWCTIKNIQFLSR